MGKPSPTHEPTVTTRAEVAALASYGVPQNEIATYIDVDAKTLRKHYRKELDDSMLKANANVAKFLYSAASGKSLTTTKGATHADCIRAAMFWAKTRMGWRETNHLEHTSPDGSMTPKANQPVDLSLLSDATLAELMGARPDKD